jgi:hypothetical protein
MDGARDALTPVSAAAGPATGGRRRSRRAHGLLGPLFAAALLIAASFAVAPHTGLAVWALFPVALVALIVTGLLGSLADAPAGRFEERLSTYAAITGWLWRALVLYAVGLGLFFGTIWLFG